MRRSASARCGAPLGRTCSGVGRAMRFVVIGAGSIGQRHLKNLLALGHDVVAVLDPSEDRRAEVRRVAPAQCLTTGDDGEASGCGAEGAVICSPTARHLDRARAALARGWHVFVEKPLAHTLEGTDALVEEAGRAGRTVLVGCTLRFLPSLVLVKRLVEEGRIGRPLAARAHCGYYLPFWRPGTDYREGYGARQATGGGIILDSIHEFDYLTWLLGRPREVFAYAGRVSSLEIDTEDNADVLLRFDYGAVANIHLDSLQRTYRRACDFIGEDGVIAWDYITQSVAVYGKEDRRVEVFQESINTERNQMFVDEMRHFVRCIQAGEPPVLDAAGGPAILEGPLPAKAPATKGPPLKLRPRLRRSRPGRRVRPHTPAKPCPSSSARPCSSGPLCGAIARAWRAATAPSEREHVTAYIRTIPKLCRLLPGPHDPDRSGRRWTVDEPADLEFVRGGYNRLGETFGIDDVLELLRRHP